MIIKGIIGAPCWKLKISPRFQSRRQVKARGGVRVRVRYYELGIQVRAAVSRKVMGRIRFMVREKVGVVELGFIFVFGLILG